jgi:hypothetical protein
VSELNRNLKGIEAEIEFYQRAIGSLEGAFTPEDLDSLRTDLAALMEIRASWTGHAEFFTTRPGAPYFPPMDWDDEKQKRYDARMRVQKILSRYFALNDSPGKLQ